MKTRILTALISVLALSFTFSVASAQNNAYIFKSDTLHPGKYYSVKTNTGTETVGMLVSADENSITLSFEGDSENILKSDIAFIHTSISGDWKYDRPLLQLDKKRSYYIGIGISFPSEGSSYYSKDYAKGLEIIAGTMLSSGKNVGFMTEVHYHHFARKSTDEVWYSSSGGDLNNFGIRMRLLTGDLDLKDVNYHFMAGIEVGISFKSQINEVYKSTSYGNTSYTYEGRSLLFTGGHVGVNVNFPVTKDVRLFLEPQFNLILGTDNPNYLALNVGVIL